MGEDCFPFPESFFSGHCKMRTNDPTIDGLIEREDPSYSILSVPSLSPLGRKLILCLSVSAGCIHS